MFAASEPRHRPGDGRQARSQIAVDIPARKTGYDQRQQSKRGNKQNDGAQLAVALGSARLGLLRHPLHIVVNIGIEKSHQRFDMVHVPAYRQVAVVQRLRKRRQAVQFAVEVQ